VEACAAAREAQSCEDFARRVPVECLARPGTLPEETACLAGSQCSSGYCDLNAPTPCGRCRPRTAAGELCSDKADSCPAGHECRFPEAGPPSLRCLPVAAEGQACLGPRRSCATGLDCMDFICRPSQILAGAPCDPERAGAPGCRRDLGLWCDPTTKACAKIPLANRGERCGVVSGRIVACASGSACTIYGDAGDGTCTVIGGEGADCAPKNNTAALMCEPSALCVFREPGRAGTCVVPRAVGCPGP
jgi:hypothetical protein